VPRAGTTGAAPVARAASLVFFARHDPFTKIAPINEGA
jgi:hypothetical protein